MAGAAPAQGGAAAPAPPRRRRPGAIDHLSALLVEGGVTVVTPAEAAGDDEIAFKSLVQADGDVLTFVNPGYPGGPSRLYPEHRAALDVLMGSLDRLAAWLNGLRLAATATWAAGGGGSIGLWTFDFALVWIATSAVFVPIGVGVRAGARAFLVVRLRRLARRSLAGRRP